jgi:hypothetical protein
MGERRLQGIIPSEIFGVPFMLAVLICVFWVITCWFFIGENGFSYVLSLTLCLFTFWFYKSRGLMILPVPIFLGIVLLCAIHASFINQKRPSYSPNPVPHLQPFHMRLYHGSSIESVENIYRNHSFLVGNSKPPAFWMADTPDKTKPYCGNNGGILVIDILPGTALTNWGGGVYIFEIPGAQPFQEPRRIPGLVPVGVLDPTGTNRIM